MAHDPTRRRRVRVGELLEQLAAYPDYYEVRLSETAPVNGLIGRTTEASGPFVVIE